MTPSRLDVLRGLLPEYEFEVRDEVLCWSHENWCDDYSRPQCDARYPEDLDHLTQEAKRRVLASKKVAWIEVTLFPDGDSETVICLHDGSLFKAIGKPLDALLDAWGKV